MRRLTKTSQQKLPEYTDERMCLLDRVGSLQNSEANSRVFIGEFNKIAQQLTKT